MRSAGELTRGLAVVPPADGADRQRWERAVIAPGAVSPRQGTGASTLRRILLDAALGYTEQSPQFKLVPVDPVRKLPLIKTGTDHAEHASTDPATIEHWILHRFPECGIAVVTGAASGVIVIDCDKKHDGEVLLRALEGALGQLPRLRVARTRNGGLHIYLAYPYDGIRVPNGTGAPSGLGRLLCRRSGVDVRADGGIAVLPPSFGYSWLADEDGPFPPIPAMWLAAIRGEGKPTPPLRRPPPRDGVDVVGRIVDDIIARHRPIADGARNGSLHKIGVRLRHANASDGRILDELERINSALVIPPLPDREVQTIARNAARGTR